jgi:hypothetical protein
MCLTLATATMIAEHRPGLPPAGRGYTRTWHLACRLSPGDLLRPDPDGRPHTVTEVHRTRGRNDLPDRITLVDQYAQAFSYRSDELVPTAILDPSRVLQVEVDDRERSSARSGRGFPWAVG